MHPLAAAGAAGSALLGILGADQIVNQGPDFEGIAALVVAISGLIATVTATVIALRKKPEQAATELALKILAEQVEKMRDEEP